MQRQIDDCSKDLLLKASLKDLCQLLDQKVSLTDVNKALEVIEKEVAACVKEKRLTEVIED